MKAFLAISLLRLCPDVENLALDFFHIFIFADQKRFPFLAFYDIINGRNEGPFPDDAIFSARPMSFFPYGLSYLQRGETNDDT